MKKAMHLHLKSENFIKSAGKCTFNNFGVDVYDEPAMPHTFLLVPTKFGHIITQKLDHINKKKYQELTEKSSNNVSFLIRLLEYLDIYQVEAE